jgi:molecular chaperone GrpE
METPRRFYACKENPMRIPIEFTEKTNPFYEQGGHRAGLPRFDGRRRAYNLREEERPADPWLRRNPMEEDRNGIDFVNGPASEPVAEKKRATGSEQEKSAASEQALSGNAQEWRDRYVRLKADLDNVRRHAGAEKDRLTAAGKDALLEDIFPMLDHLQRAIRAGENGGGRDSGILRGVKMVYSEFLSVLKKHGVKKIKALGEPFDPRLHEAVAVQEHPEYPEHTVMEEVRHGFMRGDRLLRPAHVIVAG